jgi:hypothetical protein
VGDLGREERFVRGGQAAVERAIVGVVEIGEIAG